MEECGCGRVATTLRLQPPLLCSRSLPLLHPLPLPPPPLLLLLLRVPGLTASTPVSCATTVVCRARSW